MPIDVKSYLTDQDVMAPKLGLIIYSGRAGVFARCHKISNASASKSPILGAGYPLTHQNLADLTIRLSLQPRKRELIPESCLLADPDLMVWWRPAHRRQVFFNTSNKELNAISSQFALFPSLLFMAKPRNLSIFALRGNSRPTAETILYRFPGYNVYGGGAMCAGNVGLPDFPVANADCIKSYEDGFFDSMFTHTNMGGDDLANIVGGHEALWKMLVATTHNDFPDWALKPSVLSGETLTLGSMIKKIQVK